MTVDAIEFAACFSHETSGKLIGVADAVSVQKNRGTVLPELLDYQLHGDGGDNHSAFYIIKFGGIGSRKPSVSTARGKNMNRFGIIGSSSLTDRLVDQVANAS